MKKKNKLRSTIKKVSKMLGKNRVIKAVYTRVNDFLKRRPHKSFRRTRRRDYVRSLDMPGYIELTHEVLVIMKKNWRVLASIAIFYCIATAIFVGLTSNDTYVAMNEVMNEHKDGLFNNSIGKLIQAGTVLTASVTGGLTDSNSMNTQSQMYFAIIISLVWLTTVWTLRMVLAGKKPKFRDGLYNAGSPIVSMMMIGALMMVQLLPVAIAVAGFTAAMATELLVGGGIEVMLFWSAFTLLCILSIYWLTSSLMALIIITIPGMYPMTAIKAAGDFVVGRRIRILLRLLWGVLVAAVVWVVIMIPLILLDIWLKGIFSGMNVVPVVPVAILILSSLTVMWMSSYTYILYRKIIKDDSPPA